MFRAWYIPAHTQVFQLGELSRDKQWELVQSFRVERRQNLLAESSLGEGFDFFWKDCPLSITSENGKAPSYPSASFLSLYWEGGRKEGGQGWPREE